MRRVFSASRDLTRIVRRDPEHVAERLTLYAIDRLGDASAEWARSTLTDRPESSRAQLAEELRAQTAQVARIDGAISGTPFFVALVPGYLAYLWEEMRMTLRIAALYDRDPRELHTAAEMLALRRVHPDVDTAKTGLVAVHQRPMPDRPPERRPLRTWVHSVYLLLVFGGFVSPSETGRQTGGRARIKATFSTLLAATIWVTTWVVPFTFMIVMAWGCQTHARQLGRRTLVFYDGEKASVSAAIAVADKRHGRGHDRRAVLRTVGLFLSVAVPIAFVALIGHVRNTVGLNWLSALGALVALSLVIATAVLASRR